MNRVANPFVSALLRSPLHAVISRRVMLITVYGRKSGRRFSTPVEYRWVGGKVEVRSFRGRTWWRNLGADRPVEMLLQGHKRTGFGIVLDGSDSTGANRRGADSVLIRMTPTEADGENE